LPRELRVAICFGMLGGSSYLDLETLFFVSHTSIYNNFTTALGWICDTLKLTLLDILEAEDWEALHGVSDLFAGKTGGQCTPWHDRSIRWTGYQTQVPNFEACI
jgi:hypothetical protein